MNKHSEAPWDADMFPDTQGYKIRSGGRVIAIVKSRDSDMAMVPQMNKSLIVAAPDLLEALKKFVADCEFVNAAYSDLREAEKLARAAIAKAEDDQ